jgi:hypothetical protein
MWGVARAQDAPQSKKLKAVFGTDAPIEPSRVYGRRRWRHRAAC